MLLSSWGILAPAIKKNVMISPPQLQRAKCTGDSKRNQSAAEDRRRRESQRRVQERFLGPFETVSLSFPNLHTIDCLHHCLDSCPLLPSIVISLSICPCVLFPGLRFLQLQHSSFSHSSPELSWV